MGRQGLASERSPISQACRDSAQPATMNKIKEKGVTFVRWSDEDMAKVKKAWEDVVAEENAKDPIFKEVHASYSAFRAKYKVWKDNGYLI